MTLAADGGYDAVQMREVAARANVALGTLYRYFSSKDQLLVAVLAHWTRELQQRIAARPPQEDNPADRVVDVLRRATRALERSPQLTAAVVTALSSLSGDDPPALEATREVFDIVTDIITTAMGDGGERREAIIRVLGEVWFAALFARIRGWADPRQMGEDLEAAVRLLLPAEADVEHSLAPARA